MDELRRGVTAQGQPRDGGAENKTVDHLEATVNLIVTDRQAWQRLLLLLRVQFDAGSICSHTGANIAASELTYRLCDEWGVA